MPKVSVILPVYNAERYLREAVDSVLSQTFSDFELIILNDHSSDGTESILLSYEDPRIVYVKNEENLGVARTLNKGLTLAQGEYIARMDADDISLPGRFAAQVEYLDSHPNTAVVGTDLERFGEEIPTTVRSFSSDPEQMKVDLIFACGLAHPSVMMRKSGVGPYDPEFEGLEDYELWCRVAAGQDVAVIPKILFRYRVHGAQVTKNPSQKYITRMQCLKERQLQELELPTRGEEAQCYYDFCLGKRPETVQQGAVLCRLLESMSQANDRLGVYHRDKLRATFRGVLLGVTAKLSLRDAKSLCQYTRLITPGDLLAQRCKKAVKKLLGR